MVATQTFLIFAYFQIGEMIQFDVHIVQRGGLVQPTSSRYVNLQVDVMGFLLVQIWWSKSPRPKSVSWYRQQHGPVPGTQRWMDPIESPGVSQGKTFKLWMFNGSNEGNSIQRRSKNFRKLMDTAHSRYSRCRENPAISFHSEKLEVKVNVPVVLQLLISAFP